MRYGCLFFTGLECQVRQRQVIDHIASVASFIVNRVDTLVDMLLKERTQQADEMQQVSLKAREGKIAATGAKIAYSQFLRDVTHVLAEVLQLAQHEEARQEGIDEDRPRVSSSRYELERQCCAEERLQQ